jgi:anhydro-N-acetylmuramic acid kinase
VSGQRYLGTISGTSVDGLDIALIEITDQVQVIAARTYPFPETLRSALLQLGQPGQDDLEALGASDTRLGRFIGETALDFLRGAGVAPEQITAIGSHGQTIRHRPRGPERFTLQIGDPNVIAEVTRITTIADFRRRDMAAGGEGAPLVPLFHDTLFRTPREHRAILNIGGISNLTLLPANPADPVTGFDAGPGNALMDVWIRSCRGDPFDAAGAWGATGDPQGELLEAMLADPYFALAPPKSTGREHFNRSWLDARLDESPGLMPADVQATLRVLTAEAIRLALERWGSGAERVIVCGGGRLNDALLGELRARLPLPVATVEDYGIDGDSVEAAAFAWLAHQTLNGLPGSAPSVTGAAAPRVLGAIYHA